MKSYVVIIGSGILFIKLFTIPIAIAHNLSDQFIVETSITKSIKDGYTNLKSNVKETMSSLTDEKNPDTEKYIEQYNEDRKEYQDKIKKIDQSYMKTRKEAQRNYMKKHSQIPIEEDIKKDIERIKNGL